MQNTDTTFGIEDAERNTIGLEAATLENQNLSIQTIDEKTGDIVEIHLTAEDAHSLGTYLVQQTQ